MGTLKGGFLIEGSLSENVSSEFWSVARKNFSRKVLVFLDFVLEFEQDGHVHVEVEVEEGGPRRDGGPSALAADVLVRLEVVFLVLVELSASLNEVLELVLERVFVFRRRFHDVQEVGNLSVSLVELLVGVVLGVVEL